MKNVISGVSKFQQEVFPSHKEKFESLASGQSPEVLFITCSDSRIDPNLITQTDPGDLFICRNAGNVVPPHSNETGGMTASIEFAIMALSVEHIVICGHTDCGAMKGAINIDGIVGMPHVKTWLGHCRSATEIVHEKHGHLDNSHLSDVTKENILVQLQHLKTHPAVAAKLATGKIQLHGWLYNIENAEVSCYNKEQKKFIPIDEQYQIQMLEKLAVAI